MARTLTKNGPAQQMLTKIAGVTGSNDMPTPPQNHQDHARDVVDMIQWHESNSAAAELVSLIRSIAADINPAQMLGSIKSAKKAAAARENGKQGGRPPKKKT